MHQISKPSWFAELDATRRSNGVWFQSIDPTRTALLAIDMQSAFFEPEYGPYIRGVVPNINRVAAATRAAGGIVIWTRHSRSDKAPYAVPAWHDEVFPELRWRTEPLRAGNPAHALHRDCDVAPQDIVIDKYRFSAFLPNSSPLDFMLKERGIDTVIVTGCVTGGCCESTARDAAMLDYKVMVASDATATLSDEWHNTALISMGLLLIIDVRPTASILDLLHRQE